MGTVPLAICQLAEEIIVWSELDIISISARYIASKRNALAYQLNCPAQILSTDDPFFPGVRHLPGDWSTFGRRLCNNGKCKASNLCVSLSGSHGLEGGCLAAPLR